MKIFDMLNENALQLCRIAVYSNSIAKAEMFQDGDKIEIVLTTPERTTSDMIDNENEAERLWMVMQEIVDAWGEYVEDGE